jgi:ParB family chromosome partitioning protein
MASRIPVATDAPVTNVRLTDVVVPSGRRAVRDVSDLAQSILEVGLLSPIIVTPALQLVAGGHRLEACRLLGWSTIPVRIVCVDELHRDLIEIDENVARLELSALERAEALLKRRDIYHAINPQVRPVRERGGPGRGGKKTSATMAVVRPFAQDAANRAGLSTRTVWRFVQIAENLDPEAADLLRATHLANSTTDLIRLSRMDRGLQRDVARLLANGTRTIKDAIRQLRWRTIRRPGGTPVRGRHYRLRTGDFMAETAHVADASVALLIADVPWSSEFAPRIPELLDLATRVLRVGGHALVMIGQEHLPDLFAAAEGTDLRYKWTLCLREPKAKQNWKGSVLSAWVPIVVFERPGGKRAFDFRWDVLEDEQPGGKMDPWSKGEPVLRELVDWFSQPNDLVLDSFCGSGSAGVAAVRLGRRFVGVDIDRAAVSLAASRIASATWADPQVAPESMGRAAYPV